MSVFLRPAVRAFGVGGRAQLRVAGPSRSQGHQGREQFQASFVPNERPIQLQ